MNPPLPSHSTVWHYKSFMLRLWRDTPDAPYRASLQATTDGEQVTFTDLTTLFAFLNDIDTSRKGNQGDEAIITPFER